MFWSAMATVWWGFECLLRLLVLPLLPLNLAPESSDILSVHSSGVLKLDDSLVECSDRSSVYNGGVLQLPNRAIVSSSRLSLHLDIFLKPKTLFWSAAIALIATISDVTRWQVGARLYLYVVMW